MIAQIINADYTEVRKMRSYEAEKFRSLVAAQFIGRI